MSAPSRQEERSDAFLLRAIDYRDADKIVTLLTEEHGKVGALARGARRSRKRFGGGLEPCHRLAVSFTFGRGELATLKEARVREAYPGLLTSLQRIQAAGRGLELVRRLCPEREPMPRLFEAVARYHAALAASDAPDDVALAFRARALALVGLAPGLDACGVSGAPCPPGQAALFDPERGTIVARAHGGGPLLVSGPTRALLKQAMGEGWTELEGWDDRARKQADELLLALLRAHVGEPRARRER